MRRNFCLLACLFLFAVASRAQNIHTYAGGLPNNVPANSAAIAEPARVAVDSAGNYYTVAQTQNIVFKVDASGTITVVAGTGYQGFSGDGGPATSARLNSPWGVAVDGAGNIYIADTGNQVIRKVDTSGIISRVAGDGSGSAGFTGDGGPATSAEFNQPFDVAVDSAGNIYICDTNNQRIRKVDATTHNITTVAGSTLAAGFGGDAGLATGAKLNYPKGIDLDAAGNLYIVDANNQRIRKVNATTHIITTVAGGGSAGFGGDGGSATSISAKLNYPQDAAVDNTGNIYIADGNNGCIRKVTGGVISTMAGSPGVLGYGGDGGPATSALINVSYGVAVDGSGNVFIADRSNERVRKVTGGIISTAAGTGSGFFGGDGGPATSATLAQLAGLALDAAGNLFIADSSNHRVRKVDTNGNISTVAGNGAGGYGGDGGLATAASLFFPDGQAVDANGNLYIADTRNQRIRRVDATTHVISTVAGTGTSGYSGDGGPAGSALLSFPEDVAVDALGNIYIADGNNNRIRKVDTSGNISTVVGTGAAGSSGDGGPALAATLRFPYSVAFDASGNMYIADRNNQLVRKVDATTHIISTVAGTAGMAGYSGDGGPASNARLYYPESMAFDAYGNLYIADSQNSAVRKVDIFTHNISTVAGSGTYGFSGDGGPATSAMLAGPSGVAVDGSGNLFIGDSGNHHVRKVDAVATAPAVTLSGNSLDFGHSQVGTQTVSQSVTVTNSGNAPLHVSSVSASGDYLETDDCTSSSPIAPTAHCTVNVSFLPTATGTRTGTLSITDDASGSPQTVSLTGIGDPASTTVNVSAPSVTYNANGLVTVSVTSGAGTVTGNVSLTVDGGSAVTQALASGSTIFTLSGLSAGSHNLSASYAAQGSFAAGSTTGTLTVNKLNASVTPNAANKTYGTSDPALGGTLSGFLSADGVTATYSRTAGETVAGGPYTISATLSPAGVLGNYNITYNTANFAISPANASVTPNAANKTYGTSDPAFGGTLNGFLASDSVTATYSRTAGETVTGGPYTISATLSPSGVLGNYNITYNTANFAITPALASVTPNPASKTYGAADPAFSGTLTGFLAADGVTASYSRTAGEAVAGGPYTISATLSPSGVLGNYNITYNTANFAITPALASVTPNPASKTYGAADPGYTGTLTGFLAADGVTASYSRAAGEAVAGGPYTISATLSPSGVLGNYNITYNTANFTISPANASVTPNAASKTYGTSEPAFGGTLSGFLAADGVTATYSRTAGETVAGSSYTISATLSPSGVLGNYNITYNTANFSIDKANASVTPNAASKTYGLADPALSGTLTGFLAADGVGATYSRTAGETVAGSSYTISATLSPSGVLGNYSITYNTANFNIAPAPLTITASSGAMIYGGPAVAVVPLYSGFVNNEGALNLTAQPTCLPVFTNATPVGTYGTSCSGAVDSNYAIAYFPGSVVVGQATTTTVLVSSSQNSDLAGQALIFTATVTPQFLGTMPTGKVVFTYTGVGTIDTVTLPAGSNVATTIYAPIWAGTVTASYLGDSNFQTSNSNAVGQTVKAAPIASIAPAEVQFTNQAVNTNSQPQQVKISNIGTGPLNISNITISGPARDDFSETDNCPKSLPGLTSPNATPSSCIVYVTFTPDDSGVRTATLSIADNDSFSSPQMIGLTGIAQSLIKSDFKRTKIGGGNYVWFSAHFVVRAPRDRDATPDPVQIFLTNSSVTFKSNGSSFNLPAPNAVVVFSPSATTASTTYDTVNNRWVTTVPSIHPTKKCRAYDVDTRTFLTGFAFQVPPGGLPGDIEPVTWSGSLTSDTPGVSVQWRWGAAVYTQFSTDYNALGVKPVEDDHETISSGWWTRDPAGTPENYKKYWTRGASGDDRDDFTGDPSRVVGVSPSVAPLTLSPTELNFGSLSAGNTTAAQTVTLTNNGAIPLTISSIQVTGTHSSDFVIQSNTCGPSLAILKSCSVSVTFTPGDVGTRSGVLAVTSGPDDDSQTTQTVDLGGNGTP